jgi:hypothetical protein
MACIKAMGNAITARVCRANDENIPVSHKELAELALDAAIASGYVVMADDLKAKEVSPSQFMCPPFSQNTAPSAALKPTCATVPDATRASQAASPGSGA